MKHSQNIFYSNHFQESRLLDFFIPVVPVKKDIIVFIHGNNWQNGDKNQWSDVAKTFCQNGFFSATVNYRMAPQWNFPAQIEDIRLAISFIKKQAASLGFAPNRLTLCGVGAGAYLGLLAAVIKPNEYLGKTDELSDTNTQPKIVVAISPIVSLIKGYHSPKIDSLVETLLSFDAAKEQAAFIKDCSPSERPENFKCPLLLMHNENNQEIPMPSISKFQQSLLNYQVPVRLIVGNENTFATDNSTAIHLSPESIKSIENFIKEFLV